MLSHFEPDTGAKLAPDSLVAGCIESGAHSLLLDDGSLPDAFFDLATGFAGELLHGLSKYGLRLAAVVPDPTVHPLRFQEFLREANRGGQFRFFPSRQEALAWLSSFEDG
jgi:hypothetical protein